MKLNPLTLKEKHRWFHKELSDMFYTKNLPSRCGLMKTMQGAGGNVPGSVWFWCRWAIIWPNMRDGIYERPGFDR